MPIRHTEGLMNVKDFIQLYLIWTLLVAINLSTGIAKKGVEELREFGSLRLLLQ
jgi:hypothetical protein